MRVTNTSRYPVGQLKKLLKFAAAGVRDSGIEVHVKKSGNGYVSGCAYSDADRRPILNVSKTSKYLITMKLPEERSLPKRTWSNVKLIVKKWPDGIPLDGWQDVVVFFAAQEFRYVWQWQRTERTGRGGKGMYDSTKFAMNRLNCWRIDTGRQPVEAVKQANPFDRPTVTVDLKRFEFID